MAQCDYCHQSSELCNKGQKNPHQFFFSVCHSLHIRVHFADNMLSDTQMSISSLVTSRPPHEPSILARFPLELQAMIFISSLPNIESIIDLERVSPMEAPLNVSHVCRSWRNIALATPALWTRLWFVKQQEENWTISATEAVFSLFHTFLERSAHCGLHIRLFIPFDKSQ